MQFITGVPTEGLEAHTRTLNRAMSACKAKKIAIDGNDTGEGITVVGGIIPGSETLLSANIRRVIRAIAECWVEQLKRHPLPPLYKSGVIYKPEPTSNPYEVFSDPYTTYLEGWGDCDDLVIWRIAEVLASGSEAWPVAMRKIGTTRYHVAVRLENGDEEDPSIILYPGKFKLHGTQ